MKKRVWLIIPAAVLILIAAALILVVRAGRKKADIYKEALRLSQEGNKAEAYNLFGKLGSYKDARQLMADMSAADRQLPYRAAEKGDTVFFGNWEQDNDRENGAEPVEWIVLDKIEGRLLLLSYDCLEAKAYNEEAFEPVTWETCSLRTWLNEEFLPGAFTEEEQALIPAVSNENPDHSVLETPGGRDTRDRVFLLCERDTVIYLKDEFEQQAVGCAPASEAVIADGLQVNEEGCASWWLRSPGTYEYTAQFVDAQGAPYTNGASTDITDLCGVRPVIWLDPEGGEP